MPRGKLSDARKEQYWQRLIDQWRASGLSVRAFCERQHLAVPSFYAWWRRLRPGEGSAGPVTPPVTFLPVHVRPDERGAPPPLELVLANGRRLRIPPGYDDTQLRQLLRTLEDSPC
jgi:hypothetical protein